MVRGKLVLSAIVLRILRCQILFDTCSYTHYRIGTPFFKNILFVYPKVLLCDSPRLVEIVLNPTWKLHSDTQYKIERPCSKFLLWLKTTKPREQSLQED